MACTTHHVNHSYYIVIRVVTVSVVGSSKGCIYHLLSLVFLGCFAVICQKLVNILLKIQHRRCVWCEDAASFMNRRNSCPGRTVVVGTWDNVEQFSREDVPAVGNAYYKFDF